jgi:hypothetical protein
LELPASSEESRLDDLLDFPFGFTLDDIWCGAFVVRTVGLGLTVSSQEVDMKYGVDLHGGGKCKAVRDGGQFRGDFERAVSTGCKFRGRVMGLQVTAFEPNLFVFLELDGNEAFFRHTERGLGFVPCFSDLSKSCRDVRGLGLFIR